MASVKLGEPDRISGTWLGSKMPAAEEAAEEAAEVIAATDSATRAYDVGCCSRGEERSIMP
jgi:hypothetical protein